jgi:hypothetical protein
MFRLGERRFISRIPMKHHSIVSWEPERVRASVLELDGGSAQMVGIADVATPLPGPQRPARRGSLHLRMR